MTISSIYTNQPDTIRKPGEVFAPEPRENIPANTQERESLQTVTDQASLSELAPRIQAVLSEISGSDNNVLQKLSNNVDRLQEGFIETLYTALSQENIDLNQKMTLRLDGNGALTVAGDHAEKEQVERILSENPALSTAFSEIASQSEVLRDITNINKVMTRQVGADAYADGAGKTPFSVYQMSLKGEMSHFYFSRG
ncbi:MAG: hypothetical protein DELT_02211 [Desulfovibrio sp.]